MTEEPGKFLISLVRYARSIAEKACDVPPTDEISRVISLDQTVTEQRQKPRTKA
jgi:hypothetical protein